MAEELLLFLLFLCFDLTGGAEEDQLVQNFLFSCRWEESSCDQNQPDL